MGKTSARDSSKGEEQVEAKEDAALTAKRERDALEVLSEDDNTLCDPYGAAQARTRAAASGEAQRRSSHEELILEPNAQLP